MASRTDFAPALLPTKEEMDVIFQMTKSAHESKYLDKLGGAAGVFSIALYAREMGIPIMTALFGGMQNVQGKITMSAEMMHSLIRQAGHKVEILVCDQKQCSLKGVRKDTGETYTSTFTMDDAKRAGLVRSGGSYDKYADDMLFARALTKLRRRLFPDVGTRSYVDGELDDIKEEAQKAAKEPKQEALEHPKKAEIIEINPVEEIKGEVVPLASEPLIPENEVALIEDRLAQFEGSSLRSDLLVYFSKKARLEKVASSFGEIPASYIATIYRCIDHKENSKS
jgi:hypothetical protein